MYPHPGHRCFVGRHPRGTDAKRQAAYCLSAAYPQCDRYHDARGVADVDRRHRITPDAAAHPTDAESTVIHVFRAGDTLARIAAAYGLTPEQIASANGLGVEDAIVEGVRLVIPLVPHGTSQRSG